MHFHVLESPVVDGDAGHALIGEGGMDAEGWWDERNDGRTDLPKETEVVTGKISIKGLRGRAEEHHAGLTEALKLNRRERRQGEGFTHLQFATIIQERILIQFGDGL